VEALKNFYERSRTHLSVEDVQLGLIEVANASRDVQEGIAMPVLMTRKSDLHGRTPRQNVYLCKIQEHDITFGIGPAGTGKTYLAVASAVDALERDLVKRIVLVRPAVEAGERLGFLPAIWRRRWTLSAPLYDALYDLMASTRWASCSKRGAIEIAPLAYMRDAP